MIFQSKMWKFWRFTYYIKNPYFKRFAFVIRFVCCHLKSNLSACIHLPLYAIIDKKKTIMEDMKIQPLSWKIKPICWHFQGSFWCFRILQLVNYETNTGSVQFITLQKPASELNLVWSVWQRLGIHHNKHLVPFIFCQKHIIRTLPVGLFKETSACKMWQPAVKQQETTDFTLSFSQCPGLLIVCLVGLILQEHSLWMQFFL